MADQPGGKELVSFKEMTMTNSIQLDAIYQLLIKKGVITEDEFYTKLKDVMLNYRDKSGE